MTGLDNNCFDQSVFEKVFLEQDHEGPAEHEEHVQQDDGQEQDRPEEVHQTSDLNNLETTSPQRSVDAVVSPVEQSPRKIITSSFSDKISSDLIKISSPIKSSTPSGMIAEMFVLVVRRVSLFGWGATSPFVSSNQSFSVRNLEFVDCEFIFNIAIFFK